ncbi:MAG: hypothetical protein SH847_04880 [Roseiflexaceae bacterium]|nr:hypothetical protein [Roseiflexaceae bacterium]
MIRYYTLALLLGLTTLLVTGCEQTSIARQEEIRSFETVQALTPTITPSPTATATPTATPTLTPTIGPSPTALPPTLTLIPSPTPLPPTTTPNPALRDFSLCTQMAGAVDGGRFSMRVTTITTTVETNFERVVLALDVPGDSAAPHAQANCVPATAGYEITVDLAGWQHDDAFRTSVATATKALSGTKILSQLQYRFGSDTSAGASIVLPITEPHAFHISLETKPYRLVIEVAKNPALGAASDMLAVPSQSKASPTMPFYYLRDGDIWSFVDGAAKNLTNSAEIETAFSVSTIGKRIAFCRASSAAGQATEVSSLWVMELDGIGVQELAAAGRRCSEPAFSPDGKQVAFVVDEDATRAQPPRLSIWVIDFTSGKGPDRLTSPGTIMVAGTQQPTPDEWSRFGPQWIDATRLVYVAQAEDGRSTLFTLTLADRKEVEIGASLLVVPSGQGQRIARYLGFGRPLVAPDGKTIVIEALRADKPGADLLLLDADGNEQKGPPNDGYWARPLAFADDGTLYYLTSACDSDAAQSYSVIAYSPGGKNQTVAIGQTAGSFGQFVTLGNGLAYVNFAAPGIPGPRGPLNLNGVGASSLWFWDLTSGARTKLLDAETAITGLGR